MYIFDFINIIPSHAQYHDIFTKKITIDPNSDGLNNLMQILKNNSFFHIDISNHGPEFLDSYLTRVDYSIAKRVLQETLTRSLAFQNIVHFPVEEGRIITDTFFLSFSTEARYYTNSDWNKNKYSQKLEPEFGFSCWNPLTSATFDTGIIVIDSDKIGIIWIQEED